MIKRPQDLNPLFPLVDEVVVAKNFSALERQRAKDGTPIITRGNRTALSPPDIELRLDGLSKAVVKAAPKKKEFDPDEVVKSFLEYSAKE